ncbi:hypothetical protein ASD50_18335 [Mesorhizobium sp. Root552]|uniref:hypothetical protein n=1 Tax=Mesorhizobium sp. Root552 TaxID=1736555 RepID=UPI0006FAC727|nr:hypothetical protein [Mesorhizobium sp. Root552]KQZ29150.1 hypothetical protein ASD50_18335 [Mesorhizobium sp. Root552]
MSEAPETTSQQKWNRANPAARKAHSFVARAIKRGELKRDPCVFCGALKVDLHHPDPVNEPWLTIPMCRAHHQQHHAELRRREKVGGNG